MRIRFEHNVRLEWERPIKSSLLVLRLTPRNHQSQHVLEWHVRPQADCGLSFEEDMMGNMIHHLELDGPLSHFSILIEGDVIIQDSAGVLHQVPERFPNEFFLRNTPLTSPQTLQDFPLETFREQDVLNTLHALMAYIHHNMSPKDTFEYGICANKSHLMLTILRQLNIPARFAMGYLIFKSNNIGTNMQLHNWIEAYVQDLGWVGFDPSLNLCPQEAHIRLAIGLDAEDISDIKAHPSAKIHHQFNVISLIEENDGTNN